MRKALHSGLTEENCCEIILPLSLNMYLQVHPSVDESELHLELQGTLVQVGGLGELPLLVAGSSGAVALPYLLVRFQATLGELGWTSLSNAIYTDE